MTRVMVVGADTHGEQALLARLRRICGTAADRIVHSRRLDQCDLLVIRDLPTLRQTALKVARERPGLKLWIERADGGLCDARDREVGTHALDDRAVRTALEPDADAGDDAASAPAAATEAGTAVGAKAVTRLLRHCLQAHDGHGLLSLDGRPLLLLDFGHDLAVPCAGTTSAMPALAQTLGEAFHALAFAALTPQRFAELAAGQQRLPLHPLLWQTAQASRHWQDLDRRLGALAQVRLLRWPDFRVMARQHDGFRLCSLLLKKPCSVQECSRLLGLEETAVRAFVHTAYLCGYAAVEAPAASSAAMPGEPSAGGSLLARMWRSLRVRSGA